jgi:hypothetical protein
MRSKLTLLTTAAALAFGLTATAALAADATGDAPGAKSDITIVGTNQGGAVGGAETQAAPDQGNAVLPDAGDARAAAQGSPPAKDKGGVAAQGGAQDQGTAAPDTQKQGELPSPSSSY